MKIYRRVSVKIFIVSIPRNSTRLEVLTSRLRSLRLDFEDGYKKLSAPGCVAAHDLAILVTGVKKLVQIQ